MAEASGFRFAIQKLNGENYAVWSYKVELLLIKDNLWDVISETAPSPVTSEWSKRDDQARATIGLLVEDNQLLHIRNATTAKGAWDALKEYHQKATLTSKVLLLKRICRAVLREDGDMEKHITEISTNINQLAALGQNLPDELQAALLLGSLPESYDTLVTALESRAEKDLTFQFVKSKLIDEHKRRKGARETKANFYTEETVMKSVHKENNQGKKTCFFCKKAGHFKNDCLKYKAWKNKQEKAHKVVNKETKDSNETCFVVQDTGNLAEVCLSATTGRKSQIPWFVDSGATTHMVRSKDFFTKLDSSKKGQVRLADDNKFAKVEGIGSGTIECEDGTGKTTTLNVSDVLYVPSLGSNLLSVKKLTQNGFKLLFSESACQITKNGQVQATAELSPELYQIKTVGKVCTANLAHGINCQHMWHRQFGHRDPKAIKDLEIKGLATGIKVKDCGRREICECCIKGKMARIPFPKESISKTSAILDLIHTDVCGPMQTVTPGNKRYILTIIDDFSRYTWVYLMSHKNEAVPIIKNFVKMMQTQLGKVPKIIRSDRGKEYVNGDLKGFLKKKGIITQYTAAYSPQQNGVAERKNRSLLEMARCMLLDANMDKKYWGEAVNTANYLQNRLPTKATDKTPFELWNLKKPDVKNLHIFGCEAYVHIHKEQRRKLDVKAEKYTFVGYSEESKAFRLLDMETNRIKISRDVIFLDKECNGNVETSEEDEVTFFREETNDQVNRNEDNNESSTVEEESDLSESDSTYNPEDYYSDESENGQSLVQCRRSERNNLGVPPDRYIATSKLVQESEPGCFKEAVSGTDKEYWLIYADMLTKALNKTKLQFLSDKIGLIKNQ